MRFAQPRVASRRPAAIAFAFAIVAAGVLTACTFKTPSGMADDNPGGDDDDDGSGGDDAPTQVGCHNDRDKAVLCVDFEDAPLTTTAVDHSLGGPNNVALTDVMGTDHSGQQAALLDASSTLVVAESPSLDFTNNWTLELYVYADPLPTSGGALLGGPLPPPPPPPVYWMFNNNNQYGMELRQDGTVRCVIDTKTVDSMQRVVERAWTHVACVYDGGKLHVFVDGIASECITSGAAPTDGVDGSSIGGNIDRDGNIKEKFIGALDNVALYASALSSQRICELAGHTSCPATCDTVPF